MATKSTELIVRELAGTHTPVAAIAPNTFENSNNVARFFNDTPYNLALVAVRIHSMVSLLNNLVDAAQHVEANGLAELSRQAIIAQQEGIVCNARSRAAINHNTVALGGDASYVLDTGEMLYGDFKTPIMMLEVQETLFLHSSITNVYTSIDNIP